MVETNKVKPYQTQVTSFNYLGSANKLANNEIEMTRANKNLVAAIWSKNKVNLNEDFTITADINFGANPISADGFTFALQNEDATFLGAKGQGLGLYGYGKNGKRLVKAVAIEMDTYLDAGSASPGANVVLDNLTDMSIAENDLGGGHLAWMTATDFDFNAFSHQGRVLHRNPYFFTKLKPLADDSWQPFSIFWEAKSKTIHYSLAGITGKTSRLNDFESISSCYFGFTAATGEYGNWQRIRNITYQKGQVEQAKEGRIKINYRADIPGYPEIASSTISVGKVGTLASFSPKEIKGYHYTRVEPTNASAFYSADSINQITFFYQADNKPLLGKVIVEYREDSVEQSIIKSVEEVEGPVGTTITVSPKLISGFTFSRASPTNATGIFQLNPVGKVVLFYKRTESVKDGAILFRYFENHHQGNTSNITPIKSYLETLPNGKGSSYQQSVSHFSLAGYRFTTSPQLIGNEIVSQWGDVSQPTVVDLFFEKIEGALSLEVPANLDFGTHTISTKAEQYELAKRQGDLLVMDTRPNGSVWELRVQLKRKFIGSQSQAVLDNLMYFRKGGIEYALYPNLNLAVYTGKASDTPLTDLSKTWQPTGDGPFLKVPPQSATNEKYQGTIKWTLVAKP